jgi:hypothetical protein
MDDERTTDLHHARADARRRIEELRELTPGAEATALLSRAEAHLSELRSAAQLLSAVLPTRVEAAVARAVGEHDGGLGRQLAEVRGELRETAAAVARVEHDLLADRVGRIEDLELVVQLLARGIDAVREDVSGLARSLDALAQRLDEPLQVTVERPRQLGVRHLFTSTEPVRSNGSGGEDANGPAAAPHRLDG